MSVAICFDRVAKQFRLNEGPGSLQERALHLFRPRATVAAYREPLWALKDISFEIPVGETVGLIGTNGSGKSTALKIMAGILYPSSGTVEVNGRVSALIELGAGFHPDLSGRENIYLNGTLLGLTRREVQALFDDIVGFSELERFIDMPVKHYSSGMYMRLAFSVAIHVQPDILLVDEILTVGDQAFQTKCMERIYALKREGATIVVVSHALESLRLLCSRLIWIESGKLRAAGETDDVAALYLRHIHTQENARLTAAPVSIESGNRWGSREIEITGVRFVDAARKECKAFQTGDVFTVEIDYIAHQPVVEPVFGLALHRADGTHINGPNTRFARLSLGRLLGKGVISYSIPELPLLPGIFEVTAAVYDTLMLNPFDHHERRYSFQVLEGRSRERFGLLDLRGDWTAETVGVHALAGWTRTRPGASAGV